MTMKLYLYGHMWASMLFLTLCLFLVFGFALFIIERVEQPSTFGSMEKTLFYCFTTAATIGYGRATTISKAGRFVTFLLGCYGQILMTFFTAIITNVLEPSKEEEQIKNYVSSGRAEHKYRVAAAMLIQAGWKSSKRYKVLHGMIAASEEAHLKELWREIHQTRKKSFVGGDDALLSASGRFQREVAKLNNRDRSEKDTTERDTESMPESSPTMTRTSGKDTSSMGRSEGFAQRPGNRDKDMLERFERHRHSRPTNVNSTLRLASATRHGAVFTQHVPGGYQRKSQFYYDMETVNRLNTQVENGGKTSSGGSGVLAGILRGVTREDMPETDLPSYKKRILSQQKYRPCLPLYSPLHKANFLFEAIKRFRKRKRKLAECRLEAKDVVLEQNLKEISSLVTTLDDHIEQHDKDIDVLGDRIKQELQVVREALETHFRTGAPRARKR